MHGCQGYQIALIFKICSYFKVQYPRLMGLFLEKVVIILVCIFCSDVTVTPYWLLILKISTCKTKLTN